MGVAAAAAAAARQREAGSLAGKGREGRDDVNSLVCKNRCAGKHRKLSRFGSRPGLPKYLEPDPVELGITLPVVPVELVKSVPFGIL